MAFEDCRDHPAGLRWSGRKQWILPRIKYWGIGAFSWFSSPVLCSQAAAPACCAEGLMRGHAMLLCPVACTGLGGPWSVWAFAVSSHFCSPKVVKDGRSKGW